MSAISFYELREKLLFFAEPLEKEEILLEECAGRILAGDMAAKMNVPPFDRSPYDGYAFRAEDTKNASKEHPVTLRILEEIPAGGISHETVTAGTAVKILTGAPIPKGANAVVKYELTEYTDKEVRIFSAFQSGSNIVKTGEDIKEGDILIKSGTIIDAGAAGTLASQNVARVWVHRIPKIGILSTGSELLAVGSAMEPGKIYNSNQYVLCAAVKQLGCEPVVLGMEADNANSIARMIETGLGLFDMVILTGGVSVGDYDLTPAAMELAGVRILQRGVDFKPGMACAYGEKEGKLVCGLSGNPAAAITNFHLITAPLIRKIKGEAAYVPVEFPVKLLEAFPKKSPATRVLRGKMEVFNGEVGIRIPKEQGNVVLSSTIGCNLMAIVPAGSGPLEKGTVLKGFLIC